MAEGEIRQARPGDLSWIEDCAQMAFAPLAARMGQRPAPMDADYAALISRQSVWLFVSADAHPQGFVVCFPDRNTMMLETVAVSPDAQGTGVGGLLIAFCEAQAKREGLGAVQLYTHVLMVENHALYRHSGYVETARRTENGFERVFFEKTL